MLLVRDVDHTCLNTAKKTAKDEAKGEAVEVFKLFEEGVRQMDKHWFF